MSRHYRTPQKTLPIAAVTKNVAIDLMYTGGLKMCCNWRHIAAVFATAATAHFSCSEMGGLYNSGEKNMNERSFNEG